eukprot:GEZU01020527.1.p2 GENE.GEZU01020527.1~~GEZU01020527.1.p2  ORF type:complete len:340 (-),score=90.57 GEZU01020527.1:1785-2804(-)
MSEIATHILPTATINEIVGKFEWLLKYSIDWTWYIMEYMRDETTVNPHGGQYVYEGNEWPYPQLSDIKGFFFFFCLFFFIRPLFDNLVAKPFTRSQLSRRWKPKKGEGKEAFDKTVTKFMECFWKTTYYTMSWCFGIYVASRESFFYKTAHFWKNYPFHPITDMMKLYYMISMGFYTYSIFATLYEFRRKDFVAMLIHHVATSMLIGISYYGRVYRVGIMVIILHDCNDIFLETAKMLKYLNYTTITDIAFKLFAGSWVVTRFFLFSYLVLLSCTLEIFDYVQVPYMWWLAIVYLLHVLLMLHIYWGYLIARVALRAVAKGELNDIREEGDEGKKSKLE